MTTEKSSEKERRLGGGLVLLPSDTKLSSTELFALHKAYSLADRAFCVEEGLISHAIRPLNLLRMADVHQLQTLTVAEISDKLVGLESPHRFLHNRLVHNLRAGALHGLIAGQCGLSAEEIAVGILAECMHDNFTCAGGDSWKGIDHPGTIFDEDDKFAEKIFRYYGAGWQSLCQKYGFNPEATAQEMQDIIDGRGLRGQIHEIADTASYMLGDLAEIKKAYARVGGQKLQQIISASSDGWDVWNYLKVIGAQLVVTDPWVLENFLKLRVILWENLYQNPAAKFLELLAREVVYPYLLSRKAIDLAELPVRGDTWLYNLIEKEMGLAAGTWERLNLLGAFPRRIACATWTQAHDFEDHLYAQGCFTLMFSVKDFQITKSKTDKYFVKDLDGNAASFRDMYPTKAGAIEEIARKSTLPDERVSVCWVKNPVISDNMRQAWQEARARWQERK